MRESDGRRPYVEAIRKLTGEVLADTDDVPSPLLDFGSRILYLAARLRRLELNRALYDRFDGIVQTGPFAGMKLADDKAWSDGGLAPRLLGTYEQDLHPAIERAIDERHDSVVNLGCAEGYYAVGMARRVPSAQVHARDTLPKALEVCRKAAELNGVAGRIHLGGELTAVGLTRLLERSGRTLVICDIEGAEREVLDPALAPALSDADLIVECHDATTVEITDLLRQRFAATHDVEEVLEGNRDANATGALGERSMLERLVATCEFRGARQNWLVMQARTGKRGRRSILRR